MDFAGCPCEVETGRSRPELPAEGDAGSKLSYEPGDTDGYGY